MNSEPTYTQTTSGKPGLCDQLGCWTPANRYDRVALPELWPWPHDDGHVWRCEAHAPKVAKPTAA